MAQERVFVKKAIKMLEVEKFLEEEFSRAGYSHSDIQRTPLAIRVTIYAHKPGLIIGRGGKNIERVTNILKDKFGFENPQMDVQEVIDPHLNAAIVSKQIASGIERGLNHKRVANMTVRRVMDSGAIGIAIRLSGKMGGNMSRTEKFQEGYLKFAGETAQTLVNEADATAHVKLGTIGIRVKILTELPSDRLTMQKLMSGEELLHVDIEEKTVERTEQ
ncbi:MAG: 30S ribosomal protein S3 [Nanoarchaeota archaeon]|nr:30S ribosomal protein S3 [Nanoarchaeota archaeon]